MHKVIRNFEFKFTLSPFSFFIKVFFPYKSLWYRNDYRKFSNLSNKNNDFIIKDNFPILYDKYESAGASTSEYFLQDLYIAGRVFKNNPVKHVDIGSRVDGFVAHVASFREIELFDIRDLKSNFNNLRFRQVDLMNSESIPENYCDSISCLHALEHFGLGRYGDPISPNGHIIGFNNMAKILKNNGIFYLSVPFGKIQRVEFNAHRIFCLPYLINLVSKDFSIVKFSYIYKGRLFEDVSLLDNTLISTSFDVDYGVAIFELKKNN